MKLIANGMRTKDIMNQFRYQVFFPGRMDQTLYDNGISIRKNFQ